MVPEGPDVSPFARHPAMNVHDTVAGFVLRLLGSFSDIHLANYRCRHCGFIKAFKLLSIPRVVRFKFVNVMSRGCDQCRTPLRRAAYPAPCRSTDPNWRVRFLLWFGSNRQILYLIMLAGK